MLGLKLDIHLEELKKSASEDLFIQIELYEKCQLEDEQASVGSIPPPPPPPLGVSSIPPPPPFFSNFQTTEPPIPPPPPTCTSMPNIIQNALINPIYKSIPRSSQQLKQFAWQKIPNHSLGRNNTVWKEVNEQGEKVKLDYNLLEELFTKPKIMLNGSEEKKDESKMENKSSFKKLPSLNDAPMPVDNSVN
jgi:hypothetical protein